MGQLTLNYLIKLTGKYYIWPKNINFKKLRIRNNLAGLNPQRKRIKQGLPTEYDQKNLNTQKLED